MATLHVNGADFDQLNLKKYKLKKEKGEEVTEEDMLEFEEEGDE